MIQYIRGNILDSKAQALVNTVNTVGVMGKGLALQFRNAFPNNFKAYKRACKNNKVKVGEMFVTTDSNTGSGEKIIVNFPTKADWRKPSEYKYIEDGLDNLSRIVSEKKLKSIAIPPLGAGNGGLQWERVKEIIKEKLHHLEADIYVYEPALEIREHLKKERVQLTHARALLLYVLYDLVSCGEYVSEFSSEKVCYFLQKFGAGKYFKLEFEPKFYGPYSGKVRLVLRAMNGSLLTGYSEPDKKPFDPLLLAGDAYEEVKAYVENNPELLEIANRTMRFLRGFYSDFTLALLSSLDYISSKENSFDKELISKRLEEWSDQKRSMLSEPRHLDITLKHLQTASLKMPIQSPDHHINPV